MRHGLLGTPTLNRLRRHGMFFFFQSLFQMFFLLLCAVLLKTFLIIKENERDGRQEERHSFRPHGANKIVYKTFRRNPMVRFHKVSSIIHFFVFDHFFIHSVDCCCEKSFSIESIFREYLKRNAKQKRTGSKVCCHVSKVKHEELKRKKRKRCKSRNISISSNSFDFIQSFWFQFISIVVSRRFEKLKNKSERHSFECPIFNIRRLRLNLTIGFTKANEFKLTTHCVH
jgi:hypothetical protein